MSKNKVKKDISWKLVMLRRKNGSENLLTVLVKNERSAGIGLPQQSVQGWCYELNNLKTESQEYFEHEITS